jgi:hypothetical protein
MDRYGLLRDPTGLFGRTSLGDALNSWSEANPDRHRISHITCVNAGIPMEVWVLSVDRHREATS